MRKIFTLLSALLLVGQIFAQQLQLADIAQGTYRSKTIQGVRPMLDGESYSQISSNHKQIVRYSFRSGKSVGVIFDVATARDCPFKSFDDYQFSPDEKLILIQTKTRPIYRRSFTAEYYIYNVRNNTLTPLSANGPQQVPKFSPDGTQIAFVRQNNIFLVKLLFNNSESQVTTDGKRNQIINGIPDWVYEEEFSYNSAFDFSADSKMIAYVKFDESVVPEYSFPLYRGMEPEYEQYRSYPGQYTYKYPKAGARNAKVSVHSFDIKSHVTRTIQLPIDSTDYIPRIKFTQQPEQLAIVTLNRQQNRMDLYMANARSRVARLAVRDESEAYIKETAYENLAFYPQNIVMMSARDGYSHLYLYTLQGNMVRQLTKGKFDVTDFYGWDPTNGNVYYASNEGSPLQTNIYKTDAKGRTTALTQRKGVSVAQFSHDFRYFVQWYSDAETPTEVTLCDAQGKTIAHLLDNKTLLAQLAPLHLPKKEFFTFKTSEGVELNGWMMRPANFDANRRYPVILYQYGGPGSQSVTNSWGIGAFRDGALYEAYLCSQGFIVACIDGRGTGGRGAAFEQTTYLRLGVKEASDQVEAALYLGTLPYVDTSKIGIWGWSFGGFNTIMSMSEGRPVFKAGIAVAAPTDWRYYDSVYTERYMRTPGENGDGYRESSAFSRIDKLSGRLLLIHGTADDNVHFQNITEYSEALVQAGKQFDMQIYTNRNHGIYGGMTRLHLLTRMVDYWSNQLK